MALTLQRACVCAATCFASGCLWVAVGAQEAAMTPEGELAPKLALTQFRSFPRSARVARICVIHTFGIDSARESVEAGFAGTRDYAFDPAALLASALAEGLQRTCQSTAIDPRAADPSRIDFARELAIVSEVTGVRMRHDPLHIGWVELAIDARTEVRATGKAPGWSVESKPGRPANAASPDMATALSVGLIGVVDAVNQLIFENRERLARAQ
jgi:hypothetical protein